MLGLLQVMHAGVKGPGVFLWQEVITPSLFFIALRLFLVCAGNRTHKQFIVLEVSVWLLQAAMPF